MKIIITPGEPAGIGPDCVLMCAQSASHIERVVVADPDLLHARAKQLNLSLQLTSFSPDAPFKQQAPGELSILPVILDAPCTPGVLNSQNSLYVLACLDAAIDACVANHVHALVTGPIHKGVINDAGIKFSGHTEYLAQRTHTQQVVMMLARGALRIALVTTHIPLHAVSQHITATHLENVIRILHHDLKRLYGLSNPKINITGLNPHAGEGGHMGREEIEIIAPVIENLKQQGLLLTGPSSADTAFTPQHIAQYDATLVMYHDQGLPVIKSHGFGDTVNITLGLPILRTSVDHGTALSLAGTGQCDSSSLNVALSLATKFAQAGV